MAGKKKVENAVPVVVEDTPSLTPEEHDKFRIHIADIDLKFGGGRDYNKERIEGEICTYAEQYKMSILETGKRLILLKEHEGHGGFLDSLKRLDIDPRTAQNMMSVARKFIDESGNAKALAYLPSTKLYMLASLEDEELDALEEGKEVGGLTAEDAEKLSSRALKKKLQELRAENKRLEEQHQQEIEIKDKLLSDKNKKIDELDGQLRMESDSTRWGEKAMDLLKNLHLLTASFSESIAKFNKLIDEIDEYQADEYEQAKILLVEQARWQGDILQQDMDRTLFRVKHLHPDANAIFHDLNDLTVVTGLKHGVVEDSNDV